MSPGTSSRKRIFTPSDDAMIREQRVTGNGPRHWKQCCVPAETRSCVGLTNLAFCCSSAMITIMTERSTRGGSVAAMSSSVRYWNG